MIHDEMINLLSSLRAVSLKAETQPLEVTLSREMGLLMGRNKRRLLRVLTSAIDAIAGKLFLERLTAPDEMVQAYLDSLRLDNLWRDVFKAVVRDGEAYVLVKPDGGFSLVEAYNGKAGAQYIHAPYDNEVILYAVNVWYHGKQRHCDVYFTDRVETYVEGNAGWSQTGAIEWTDTQGMPLGLALVRFDIGQSDVINAVQIQNDLNEAVLDMVAVSRTMGFPQRYTSGSVSPGTLTNQYGQSLTDSLGRPVTTSMNLTPGAIPHLREGTSLNQLPAAEPDTGIIDKLLHLLSVITTVPIFYFGNGDFPSGIALIQAEARLNSKVESHQGLLTPSVQEMLTLALRVANTYRGTSYQIAAITISWASPEIYTIDLQNDMTRERIDNAIKLKTAGLLSTEDALRMAFPDRDELDIQQMASRAITENSIVV